MSTSEPDSTLRAVVAMATFRRPDCLDRILPLLLAQAADAPVPTSVLVVDNDPEAGARPQVEAYADRGVRYVHEPRPGIAAARNRALDESADLDLLVFIDDDEIPGDGWLRALLEAWLGWRCAAVVGPVEPVFEGEVDAWVEGSRVFQRAERATGTVVPGAATNNLLLDLAVLRRMGLRFDDAFGLTGGSDTMLTRTLTRNGGQIRWCDEAVVTDIIPASRTTRDWVMRRTIRTSNDWSRVHLELDSTAGERLRTRVGLTVRSVWRAGRGSAVWTVGALRREPARQADGALDVARALGMCSGAWGYVWTEYKRP